MLITLTGHYAAMLIITVITRWPLRHCYAIIISRLPLRSSLTRLLSIRYAFSTPLLPFRYAIDISMPLPLR